MCDSKVSIQTRRRDMVYEQKQKQQQKRMLLLSWQLGGWLTVNMINLILPSNKIQTSAVFLKTNSFTLTYAMRK